MAFERLALSRSTLDRAAHRRAEPDLLLRLTGDPSTRLLPVHEGRAPVVEGPHGPIALTFAVADRPDLPGLAGYTLFVGVDEKDQAHLAVSLDDAPDLPAGARWAGLREVGADLDDTGVGALTAAVALLAWHDKHPRCSRCGSVTEVTQAGWLRQCPVCAAEHYPRSDPAVIMSVVDPAGRILLGRQAAWPPGRYSTLAGFVEPGESLEDAVRREVREESAVVVDEVSYRASQPWPFPSSLMVGFRGEASTTAITVDGDELADARWWSRDELIADLRADRLRLPPPISISRHLIQDWFGAPLP